MATYTITVKVDIDDVFTEIPEIFDEIEEAEIEVEYKVHRNNLKKIVDIDIMDTTLLSVNNIIPFEEQSRYYYHNISSKLLSLLETACYTYEEYLEKQGK